MNLSTEHTIRSGVLTVDDKQKKEAAIGNLFFYSVSKMLTLF